MCCIRNWVLLSFESNNFPQMQEKGIKWILQETTVIFNFYHIQVGEALLDGRWQRKTVDKTEWAQTHHKVSRVSSIQASLAMGTSLLQCLSPQHLLCKPMCTLMLCCYFYCYCKRLQLLLLFLLLILMLSMYLLTLFNIANNGITESEIAVVVSRSFCHCTC